LKEYWNLAHASEYSYWTSSKNTFSAISRALYIPVNLQGKRVLVVGPGGEGPELYGAAERGAVAAGLDISEIARNKFSKDFPMYDWTGLRGKYDEVWIHLVAQHMSDSDLNAGLTTLAEHLNKGAKIRIQFAVPYYPNKFIRAESSNSLASCKSGSNIRNFRFVYRLCRKAGFRIRDCKVSSLYPEHKSAHLTVVLSVQSSVFWNLYSNLKFYRWERKSTLASFKLR
jgi:hypothetical protein